MFTIGDFARYGRVSVRMLHHYDGIGLLKPARVDAVTGYRFYDASQLATLNRIVALKDLGFTLADVQSLIEKSIGVDELRGMLTLRRSQLRAQLDADAVRLTSVEARLRIIESEGTMPETEVIVKQVPAVRIAEVAGIASGYQPSQIMPVIGPLYDELIGQLMRREVQFAGPNIAWYEDAGTRSLSSSPVLRRSRSDRLEGKGGSVIVHAGVQLAHDAPPEVGATMVDLPAVEAATILHHGSMDNVMPSVQALARWIEANGHTSTGFAREVYLEAPMDRPDEWVTELQDPLTGAAS